MHNFTFEWTLICAALLAQVLYVSGVVRQATLGRSWNCWRLLSFSAGVAALVIALGSMVTAPAHHDLNLHMLQHLLLGMLAPLGLVMAAPITLLLRNIPVGWSRRFVRFLKCDWIRIVSHPVGALGLNIGGMYFLYLSPLYALTLSNAWLHGWVHLHFIVAGCLFTWAIAGPDPSPERPSIRMRLVVLFVSVALHALLAKLMYAYGWPRGAGHSLEEIQSAAKLMYYGGDLAELLLILAFFTTSASSVKRSGWGEVFTQHRAI